MSKRTRTRIRIDGRIGASKMPPLRIALSGRVQSVSSDCLEPWVDANRVSRKSFVRSARTATNSSHDRGAREEQLSTSAFGGHRKAVRGHALLVHDRDNNMNSGKLHLSMCEVAPRKLEQAIRGKIGKILFHQEGPRDVRQATCFGRRVQGESGFGCDSWGTLPQTTPMTYGENS